MATLQNQGTLLFTPQGGVQSTVVSNTTSTELQITYGLEVIHAAYPMGYTDGDEITYMVIMRNTGSGALILPTVTVDLAGGALDYVEGSATAFLYVGDTATPYPFGVTQGSVIFSFTDPLPAGGTVLLTYRATVNAAAGDSITSTATATAAEGVATGPVITDSDSVTITRTPVTIVKTAPATATVGDTISYTFSVTNNTSAPIALNTLTDRLPAQFSLTAVTLTQGGTTTTLVEGTDYTLVDGLLTVAPTALSLAAGETVILTVTGVVTA